MDVYVEALGGADHSSFYTDEAILDAYKNYISTVVNRYKNSTAIYAWELGNEPRCEGCEASVITKWATTISEYVKSLDPDHMVALGDEGFFNKPDDPSYPYQGGEGVDFEANLEIETLDFGTFHLYTESWGQDYDWGNKWIADHAAACAAAGKSCVFEEYGVPEDGATRDRVMGEWHDTILANATDIPADLYWQFGLTLSDGPTHDDTVSSTPYFVRVMIRVLSATCGEFQLTRYTVHHLRRRGQLPDLGRRLGRRAYRLRPRAMKGEVVSIQHEDDERCLYVYMGKI